MVSMIRARHCNLYTTNCMPHSCPPSLHYCKVVENFLRDLQKRATAGSGAVGGPEQADSEDEEPDFDANAEA